MDKVYKTPFNWDYVDDKTLIYDKGNSEEEIRKMINEALEEALEDTVDGAVDEAISNMDIKIEGENLLYKLIVNGSENGEINIPKDRFLKSTSYDSENKKLIFVMETLEGETTIEVSMSDLVASIEEKNAAQDEALAEKADKTELEPLATKAEVEAVDAKVDAIEIPDVSGFAVKTEVTEEINAVSDALSQFESQIETALSSKADSSDLETLATKAEVEAVDAKVDAIEVPDISDLATKTEVEAVDAKVDAIEIPDISDLATKVEVEAKADKTELEPLAVKSEVDEAINTAIDTFNGAIVNKADKTELEPLATKAEIEAVDAKVDAIEIPPTNKAFHEDWPTNTTIDAFCGAVSADPEAVVGESYLGELTCSGLPNGMGNGEVKVEVLGDTENKILLLTATSTNLAPYHWELTYIDGDKYGWRAWVEDSSLATVAKSGNYADLEDKPTIPSIEGLAVASDVTAEIAAAVADKANVSDIPTKTSQLANDSGFLTSHQSLEDYATKSEVSSAIAEVVGGAPATLDTLKEIADALTDDETTIGTIAAAIETKANASDVYTKGNIDDKIGDLGEVVEKEAQEATYWEEGDDLPDGVQVGDVKTSAVAAVTREKSVKEYVDESVQTVNEKPEVLALEERMNAMENALKRVDANAYQTMMNDLEVLDTLKDANAVTIEEGTIGDIIIPQTTKSKTINGELETNSSLTLNSRYGVTINNTGSEPTDLVVNAPAVEGYNAATITLNGGEYGTITVTDASLTVQNNATVQNVVITEDTTKNLTINAMFAEGATVTSNSDAAITLTSKNPSGEEVSVVLDAPGATVTMSGGSWVNVEANVSPNTLIINKAVHIDNLTVTQGNVLVKVARQADIANVVGNYTLAEGCSIDYIKDNVTNDNQSVLTSVGEHTLVEDIAHTGNFTVGTFSSDYIVWNLNNHTITINNTRDIAGFLVRANATLEINGDGSYIVPSDYAVWVRVNNGAATGVVINGGYFEGNTHILYAEKGVIEVNGGTFKLNNPDACDKDANGNFKFLLNCLDANYQNGTANIIVRGGKFYGFNPAVTYGEPGGPVSYVAQGYHVVESVEDGMKVFTVVAD